MVSGIGTPPTDELIFYTAEKMTPPKQRISRPLDRVFYCCRILVMWRVFD